MTQPKSAKDTNYYKPEVLTNRKGDILPFAYFPPSEEGKVGWHCGYDQNEKITSIFFYKSDDETDKKISYLASLKEAIFIRDELIRNGWIKIKPHDFTVKYDDGTEKPLNRDQKRQLSKRIEKLSATNPY